MMESNVLQLAPLTRPRPLRLREVAYRAIKEAILSGKIEAYEPLVEERLSSALGISRTPVREALAILDHEGLIASRSGRGLYIRELSREEFLDLFSANEAVEPYLAQRAATVAKKEDIVRMEETIEIGRRAAVNQHIHESLRSGREFHRVLGETAGNASLTEFIVKNEEQVDLFLLSLYDPGVITTDMMEASNREHADILNAIRQHDADAARRLVVYHAQSLRQRDEHLFRSINDESD
jgi:DNA-binding GntR family transcriptional regulator